MCPWVYGNVGMSLNANMEMIGALSPYQEMEVALRGCIFETIYEKRAALSGCEFESIYGHLNGCIIDSIYRNEWVWLENHRWERVGECILELMYGNVRVCEWV